MAATDDTRRERILKQIRRRMEEIQEGQPISDPFRTTFDVVTRGAGLEGLHKTAKCGVAILDPEEDKDPKIGQMVANLQVTIEYFAWVPKGEEPSTVGNRVMGDIQRKMREDLNLTEPDDGTTALNLRQLSENVEEARNSMFIDGVSDTQITGAVIYNVTYKHGIDDPRELVSSL